MSEHTKGRLIIDEQPSYSPHRMYLRGGAGDGWERGSFDVYHIQEHKGGAARGTSPNWQGFDERDVAVMRRLVACWNALLHVSTEALEQWGVDASANVKAHAQIQDERDAMQRRAEAAEADMAAAEKTRDELLKALRAVDAADPGAYQCVTDLLAKHAPKVTT